MAYEMTELMPHGDIEQVFTDIYFVTGTSRPNFDGVQWQFSRNMTIVREGDDLTLINTVRLDDERLAALDALGAVKNVVKIGAFHGIDDAFYVDRYQAKLWAMPGMKHESGLPTDVELVADGEMPFAGCSLFSFATSKAPEGLLLVDRDGGVLVSCDSLQNWAEVDEYFSEECGAQMKQLGFIREANVGPGWMRFCSPEPSDFAAVKTLSFSHLLSAHGAPLRDDAHGKLSARFNELFGV